MCAACAPCVDGSIYPAALLGHAGSGQALPSQAAASLPAFSSVMLHALPPLSPCPLASPLPLPLPLANPTHACLLPPSLPLPPAPARSNQGGIKGALSGKASENVRGRVDNVLAALSKKAKKEIPVQVGCDVVVCVLSCVRIVLVGRCCYLACQSINQLSAQHRPAPPPPPPPPPRCRPTPAQVFIATKDDEHRKPGTGMWDFFVQHANAGVAPSKA